MGVMEEVVKKAEEAGIRDKVKIPVAFTPASAIRGLSTCAPMFMALAATSTSGTYTSLRKQEKPYKIKKEKENRT